MVQAETTYRKSHMRALIRAFERACLERIVVFRVNPRLLGVATVKDGRWQLRPYEITIYGPRVGDISCNCDAGLVGRICKHRASALFARKHGVYACKPRPTSDPMAAFFN